MTEGVAATTSQPEPEPAPRSKGFLEWLTRRRTLARARAYRSELPAGERHALERALRAQELADRAYDPTDPLRAGSSLSLSISLYREAAYFALNANGVTCTTPTLAAVFEAAPQELMELAAAGPEGARAVRRALAERTFVDTAALPPELLRADADSARAFVAALLRLKLEPEALVGRLLLQRAARTLSLVAVLAVLLGGSSYWMARMRRGPDLADHKPWTASSTPDVCHPEQHRCAGAHTDMFFTTSEEVNPWVQIDLGRNTSFNQIEVTNRDDCCPDRAVPLVVEVSVDAVSYREVIRRTDTFTSWQADFAKQTARYVRLRVPRRTILHLVKVSVRHVG